MNEQKDLLFDKQGKFYFFFGLVSGVAGMSVILFIVLMVAFFKGASGLPSFVAPANNQGNVGVNQATDPLPQDQQTASLPVRPIDDTDRIKGSKSSNVEVIEYSDFECPFCGQFYNTIKQVQAEYGDRVKFAYRHFPLSFHPEAQKAAEASECAGDQGKFWEMHDKIFEAQKSADFNVAGWKKFAGQLALKMADFNSCLDSGRYEKKVQDQLGEGALSGVQGTPATFINGQIVSGALPYAQIKAQIEAALAK